MSESSRSPGKRSAGASRLPPGAQRLTPSPTGAPSAKQILSAIQVRIPPGRSTLGYGVIATLVAAVLVVLPLAYLTLVACVLSLIVVNVIATAAALHSGGLRGAEAAIVYGVYALSALLGTLLVLSLLKPVLFRRRPGEGKLIALRPGEEPLLFAFVEKLCKTVGSLSPRMIEVDCTPNLSTRLRHGLSGIIGEDELVARIGLPLVAEMNIRQLAGALARELGYFAAEKGMRAGYLVRGLMNWFADVVYGRDRLDDSLIRLKRSGSVSGRLVYLFCRVFTESARGLLLLPLMLAQVLSARLLRQMEIDADRYEAYLAGAEDLRRRLELRALLGVAAAKAGAQLAESWEQRRLADDLPAFIVARARALPEPLKQQILNQSGGRTRWFDLHPSHAERVRLAATIGAEGLVQCDLPAASVFHHFESLCRRASFALYGDSLHGNSAPAGSVPTAGRVAERVGERDAFETLRRFFRDALLPQRPILPGEGAGDRPPGPAAAIEALRQAREAMIRTTPDVRMLHEYASVANAMAVARARIATAGASAARGMRSSLGKAEAELRGLQRQQDALVESLAEFEQHARVRLTCGLQLLHTTRVAQHWPGIGEDPGENAQLVQGRRDAGRRLIEVCNALSRILPQVQALRDDTVAMHLLLSVYNPRQRNEPLAQRIRSLSRQIRESIDRLCGELAAAPFTSEQQLKDVCISTAFLEAAPDEQQPRQALTAAGDLIDGFYALLLRSLATLTQIAEHVETAVGLPALPEAPVRVESEEPLEDGWALPQRRHWTTFLLRTVGGLCLLALIVALMLGPGIIHRIDVP